MALLILAGLGGGQTWRPLFRSSAAANGEGAGSRPSLRKLAPSQIFSGAPWAWSVCPSTLPPAVVGPLLPRVRERLIAGVRGIPLLLRQTQLPSSLPEAAFLLPVLLLIAGCLFILIRHLVRQNPADRPALRLMLAAIVVAFGPGPILLLGLRLLGEPVYAGIATLFSVLALPLLPALPALAVYRKRLGRLELVANRVAAGYCFALLYAMALTFAYGVISRLVPASVPALALGLALSLLFVLAARPIYDRLQEVAEQLIYDTRVRPQEILRGFASQLPTATTWRALEDLLETQVARPLSIQQSVLLLTSNEPIRVVCQSGVEARGAPLRADQIGQLTASAGEYPRPQTAEGPWNWVRLALPIGAKNDQAIGLWLLGGRGLDDFYPQRDIRLLSAVAAELAAPLQSLRRIDEAVRRAEEFEALYEAARDIPAPEDLQFFLRGTMERALSLVGAQAGGIFLPHGPGRELQLAIAVGAASGVPLAAMAGAPGDGETPDWKVPEVVDNFDRDFEGSSRAREKGVRAYVRCPILAEKDLEGLLVVAKVDERTGPFTGEDVRLLGWFAALTGNRVRTARLYGEARQRAEQLRLLHQAGLGLNRLLDPKQQLTLLFESVQRALQADEAEFFRYDPDSGELTAEMALGIDPAYAAQWKELHFPEKDDAGPIGWAAARHEAIHLSNMSSFAGWAPVDPAIHSGIWAPVEREGRLLGVLGLTSSRSAAFSQEDVDLLLLFADQAAVALENARLFRETELRLQRMSSSRSIDTAITGSLDLRVTLNVLLDQVTTQLGMDAADVLLFNTHTQLLEFAAARGFRSRALQNTRLQVGKGLAGQAALEREIVHVADLIGQPGELSKSPLLGREEFVEYYGVPLIAKAQLKGVLEVFSRKRVEPDPEWLDFLETIAGQAAIAVDNATLFDGLQRANVDLTLAYDSTLDSLVRALDLRNHEPEGHTSRVAELTLQISRILGIGEADLVHLRRGALLHDLGHLGIPEAVLLKAGPLNEREWGLIRRHPVLAFELLSPIEFLRPAVDIPYCHHEKWDGTGYPRGLAGEQIPIAARVFSVVDVWESLTSDRPFREAWSREQTRKYIWDKAGTHFDPAVVEIFLESVSRT